MYNKETKPLKNKKSLIILKFSVSKKLTFYKKFLNIKCVI